MRTAFMLFTLLLSTASWAQDGGGGGGIPSPVPAPRLESIIVSPSYFDSISSTETFVINPSPNAIYHYLYAPYSSGAWYFMYQGQTSVTVSGLANGFNPITLWTYGTDGQWRSVSYNYYVKGIQKIASELTSPLPGSTLSGSSITATITQNPSIAYNYLYFSDSSTGWMYMGYGQSTANIQGLPTDGRTITVYLYSVFTDWSVELKTYTMTATKAASYQGFLVVPAGGWRIPLDSKSGDVWAGFDGVARLNEICNYWGQSIPHLDYTIELPSGHRVSGGVNCQDRGSGTSYITSDTGSPWQIGYNVSYRGVEALQATLNSVSEICYYWGFNYVKATSVFNGSIAAQGSLSCK